MQAGLAGTPTSSRGQRHQTKVIHPLAGVAQHDNTANYVQKQRQGVVAHEAKVPQLPAQCGVHLLRVQIPGLAPQIVQDGLGPPALGLFLRILISFNGRLWWPSDQARLHGPWLSAVVAEIGGSTASLNTLALHQTSSLQEWLPFIKPLHAGKRAASL